MLTHHRLLVIDASKGSTWQNLKLNLLNIVKKLMYQWSKKYFDKPFKDKHSHLPYGDINGPPSQSLHIYLPIIHGLTLKNVNWKIINIMHIHNTFAKPIHQHVIIQPNYSYIDPKPHIQHLFINSSFHISLLEFAFQLNNKNTKLLKRIKLYFLFAQHYS